MKQLLLNGHLQLPIVAYRTSFLHIFILWLDLVDACRHLCIQSVQWILDMFHILRRPNILWAPCSCRVKVRELFKLDAWGHVDLEGSLAGVSRKTARCGTKYGLGSSLVWTGGNPTSLQPSERSSHRPSGSPAGTRRCSVQLGLDAPRRSCCECHQQRFSRPNIPSFLFQCLLASLSILLDVGWLCYDCSILFSKGFRKAKTVKRGKDLPGGRFWQRKQHCLAALQVLLPRLESGDGVPEETQGSSRKSVWVFSGFDKIIPIFDTSMITWHGIGSQRHCHFWMWTK